MAAVLWGIPSWQCHQAKTWGLRIWGSKIAGPGGLQDARLLHCAAGVSQRRACLEQLGSASPAVLLGTTFPADLAAAAPVVSGEPIGLAFAAGPEVAALVAVGTPALVVAV